MLELLNQSYESRLIGSLIVFTMSLILGFFFCVKHKGDTENQYPALAYSISIGGLLSCGSWHTLLIVVFILSVLLTIHLIIRITNKYISRSKIDDEITLE